MGIRLRKSRLWGDTLNAPTVVHMKTNIQQLKVIIAGDAGPRWTEVLTMRMIDADKLEKQWTIASPEPYNTDAVEVLESIREAPTIDAVPVVYCKNCEYRTEFDNCEHPRQHGILPTTYPYDFCSYGVAKKVVDDEKS